MSEAELIDAYYLSLDAIDGNFEFWFSATAAMIAAAFLASEKMSWSLALFLAGIYALASGLFVFKLFSAGEALH